ncbi:hypothetical protein MUN84_00925 [Hymenobacter sp. 5516J-16]|uniref:Uncharacterized protein n=1 Tax=Hymenobacter sublimis TaxID=2933777 RepID=A0ABY4JEH8_9BACT|nr:MULTISPECIES: hypothetical protein [Hymenobacter]UOQ77322.1 hypothetical protein MUN84_00925 [Hymenobacter sp. 5516J-16]UPL51000.1 hypothetical protein MWH26_08855 [Hymenobacter sublimis]
MTSTSTPLILPATSTLTRQQRAWIALYSLEAGRHDRTAVLQQNSVTEADLAEFVDSWLRLRRRATLRQLL